MRNVATRAEGLREAADRVESARARLIAALVRHGLRTHALAEREVDAARRRLLALAGAETRVAGRGPVGTVAILLPGNAALSAPLTVIGSALLPGNRVLVRLPRRTAWLREHFEAILAPSGRAFGIVDAPGPEFLRRQLAPGGADVTVVFGDDRWASGYEDLARHSAGKLIFEGPGKDPFLVLPGADLDAAAAAAVRGAFYNGGQACTSPERVYVHESLLPGFLERALPRVERLVVGPNEDPRTDIGPFTSTAAVERFVRQVTDALARGARHLWPPLCERIARPAGGGATFLAPVVLTGVHHGMTIMREETFGPALPICAVSSAEEAVAMAEDSPYGLSASVFGSVPETAPRLRRSHGLVFEDEIWLDFYDRNPLGPTGGFKRSGWVWEWDDGAFIRREGPREMLRECSEASGGEQRADVSPD